MNKEEAIAILEKSGAEGLRMDFDEVQPDELSKFTTAEGWRAQVKWDGWFVALVVKDGKGTMYSRKTKYREGLDCSGLKDNIYFAELIENTQWSYKFRDGQYHGKLVLFDALEKDKGYKEFLEDLRRVKLPDWILVVEDGLGEPKQVFEEAVKQGFEGVILINNGSRIKVKKIIEDDYTILDIQMSDSVTAKRVGGMAKAIVYGKEGKVLGQVGSMPHQLKIAMFQNPKSYIGRVVTVRGKERFKSGALRHPAFVCLREDK